MLFDAEIEDALAVVRSMTRRQQLRVAKAMRSVIIDEEEAETMTFEERKKLSDIRDEAFRERMRAFRKRHNLDE